MSVGSLIATGFATVLTPTGIFLMFIGVAVGIVFGALPGLSATMAIALFLPVTYAMASADAMTLLMALFIGAISGGLISAILLREHPGTAIVTDSITSTGLAKFIAGRGGVHRRFRRGYRNVINEALRLNAAGQDCQLAIETSGHAAMKENYFLDDGAYLVTKFLIELACGRDLEAMIADLAEPAESREFRMKITDADFKAAGQAVLDELARYAAVQPGWSVEKENYEGVRVNLDRSHGDGWFLLRLSLHDPLLPLNIESDSPGGLKCIARELAPFLAEQHSIDAAAVLEAAI